MEAALAKFEVAEQIVVGESEVEAGADEQTAPARPTECSDDRRVVLAPAGISTASLLQPGWQTIRTQTPARGAEAWCQAPSTDAPPPAGSPESSTTASERGSDDGLEEAPADTATSLASLLQPGHQTLRLQTPLGVKVEMTRDPMTRSSDRPEAEVIVSAKIVAVDDAKVTMEVVVPVGVQPGERFCFKTPVGMPAGHPFSGKLLQVKAPSNLRPGRRFRVNVPIPAATSPAPARSTDGGDRTAASSDDELVLGHSSAKLVQITDATMTLEVVVPAGTQPGETVGIQTEFGRINVTVPPGLTGRKFCVVVDVDGTTPQPTRSTDGSERSHRTAASSDDEAVVVDAAGVLVLGKVMVCVNELCGWQRADGPAGSQEARAKLLTQLSELVASDEELRDASTDARAHTVLAYLNMFQQLRTADWEAAQIILAALQAEGPSPDRASPLQAIQGLLVVVHDGTNLKGYGGNFVGLDIDSGR